MTALALEIAWTKIASENVAETLAYIAGDDDEAARRWHRRIVAAVERAAEFPRSGRVVPELGRDDVREVIAGNYRVMYRFGSTRLVVWAVREGRRLLDTDSVNLGE